MAKISQAPFFAFRLSAALAFCSGVRGALGFGGEPFGARFRSVPAPVSPAAFRRSLIRAVAAAVRAACLRSSSPGGRMGERPLIPPSR